jgi:uncharacterized protein (DUF1330 family)
MPVYAIAQLTIHDRDRYRRYADRFMPVLTAHGGRLLAADDRPQVLEGDWPRERVVMVEFADTASLKRWTSSPDYKALAAERQAAADAIILVVHGIG